MKLDPFLERLKQMQKDSAFRKAENIKKFIKKRKTHNKENGLVINKAIWLKKVLGNKNGLLLELPAKSYLGWLDSKERSIVYCPIEAFNIKELKDIIKDYRFKHRDKKWSQKNKNI